MEVLAVAANLPLPILRGHPMIPDSILLALFILGILLAPIWWGHTKPVKEDSK